MSFRPTLGDEVAGRYELRSLLEEAPGYTGFRAFDRDVEVEVALWWMQDVLFPDDKRCDAFIGAVVDLRSLVHPHLRRLFDVGRSDGGLYVTTQSASSEGLRLRIGRGRRAPEIDVIRYATAITEALEAGHALGHVHGRMVPTDIVEVSGQIKVGGVGLYRDADRVGATAYWEPVERYLAPEVIKTGEATPASDTYSMAAILVELASGASSDDIAESTQVLSEGHIELADVLAQGLLLLPEHRPPSPIALLRRMREVMVDGRVPTAERPIARPRLDKPRFPMVTESDDPMLIGGGPGDEGATVNYLAGGSPAARDSDPTIPDPEPAASGSLDDFDEVIGDATEYDESVQFPVQSHDRMYVAPSAQIPLTPRTPTPQSSVPDTSDPGSRSVPEPRAKIESGPVEFVSMKPASEPGTKPPPRVSAADRPELQPKILPIPRPSVPQGGLGHYAPPRESGLQPVQRRTSKVHTAKGGKRVFIWLIVLILIAAGVAIGIVVLQDRSNGGNSGRDRSPDAKAAISSVRPTPDSGLRTGS